MYRVIVFAPSRSLIVIYIRSFVDLIPHLATIVSFEKHDFVSIIPYTSNTTWCHT